MSPSIAKREKLFGPVQLVLIAVLFALAFYYLLPRQEAFEISDISDNDDSSAAIGELDLAYLRARSANGQQSLEETARAVTALVRTGQVDAAQALLDKQPETAIGAQQRFALDLELARVEYFAAKGAKQRESSRLQLLNRIQLLIDDPTLRSKEHLLSSATLTEQLDKPDIAAQLYKILAGIDPSNAGEHYAKCADASITMKRHAEANACLNQAIKSATSPEAVFQHQLAKLTILSNTGSVVQLDKHLAKLVSHQPMSVSEREQLTKAMLANSRADLAYLEYEKLADTDKPNRKTHLLNAARWAEASNQGAAAAQYLDEAAELSTLSEKVLLLENAERLLVAAGETEIAFERLRARIKNQPNNEALLQEGILRARQLGKTSIAAQWNAQLVDANPNNIEAVSTQIELALANRDLKTAAKWSRHAVALAPHSVAVRKRHAQIAEWNGDPFAALKQWQWIAQTEASAQNLTQLIRLAELNREAAIAAQGTRQLLSLTPHDDEKIARLVALYELEGKPIAAASMLNELQKNHGLRAFPQRELARLYQRHFLYPEALLAWGIYEQNFGQSSEETINRMELHWRLNQHAKAANVAKGLIGNSHASEANPTQLKLISEIAWRFRIPELAQLIQPHMDKIEDEYVTAVLGKRFVQSLEDTGDDERAVKEATRLWQSTGSADMAFTAMNLAYRTGNTQTVSSLLHTNDQTAALRDTPNYWVLAAAIHQKNGDNEAAQTAREKALALDPKNVSALSGMLWVYIDQNNTNAIATFIEQYQAFAETEAELWSPFAIAHLHLGLPELSLTWFDRQLDRIEADYGMLLTFADALEYAGRAEPARKVRLYAIQRLRPVLAEGSVEDKDVLLRQYAQLLNRYGSAEDKERLAQWALNDADTRDIPGQFWREDIAISWLMATQRHEHARVVMAKLHEKRLQAPAWQKLSLALASKNVGEIHQVLNGEANVSIGNHILALRQVGRDKEAYALARKAMHRAPTLSDREVARSQFSAMRSERPRFTAANVKRTSMSGLGINQTGFTIRHSLSGLNLGFALDFTQRAYTSDRFQLNDNSEHSDVALSIHHGDRQFGGFFTAGFRAHETDDLVYASSRHHLRNRDGSRTLSAELAYNERATDSVVFRLAAKQNRVTFGYEQDIGFREYVKLQADMRDISTRVQQKRIARGLSARMEFGIRGAIGSNVWSTNIAATRVANDVVSSLPEELALSPYTTIDNLIARNSTALTLGASISRGGVATNYPQASSPRYYLNANVGQTWPDSVLSAQLDGGAGIRVLGGDELSIGFSHDTQPLSSTGDDNATTSFGVNYQYHF